MEREHDVIVIGAGGSGLAAAVSAAENGCSVLVLEKRPEPGGTTGIAVGSFTAGGTAMQRAAGIDDSVEDHVVDAGRFAPEGIESRNDAALRRRFLGQAAETLEWLRGMGLSFYGPSPEPPNRVSRMHNVMPNAKAYVAVLQARLTRLGGRLHCGAAVGRLLVEEGRVVGVDCAASGMFRARRGVVLAAGDYANSPEMIARHKGERFASIEGINPHATGDGHRLAAAVGARLVNMDVTYGPELRFVPPPGKPFRQLLPSAGVLSRVAGWLLPWAPRFLIDAHIRRLLVTWQHPENALFDEGAILLNRHGERFCNELEWPGREIAIAGQPGKEAFLLLDERLCTLYSQWPHFVSTAPKIAYAYVDDYLRLRPDISEEAASPVQLRRVDGQAAGRTVAVWNEAVAKGLPDDFGRSGGRIRLQGGRWVLLGPARAYFTTTEGGAAIDPDLRVLDARGIPIPGLYAVGQNGLGGQILWGHGLHIGWALTSGHRVGKVLGQISAVGVSSSP